MARLFSEMILVETKFTLNTRMEKMRTARASTHRMLFIGFNRLWAIRQVYFSSHSPQA